MSTFIKRRGLAAVAAVAVLCGGFGVAIAQSRSGNSDSNVGTSGGPAATYNKEAPGSSPENPQGGERGVGLPKGPFIDFCPSTEQLEAHWKQYGLDYKPVGVACTREGEVALSEKPVANSDSDLSDQEACEADKALLRSARTVPDGDGNPNTISGVLPDGREIGVDILGDVEEGRTLKEEASVFQC